MIRLIFFFRIEKKNERTISHLFFSILSLLSFFFDSEKKKNRCILERAVSSIVHCLCSNSVLSLTSGRPISNYLISLSIQVRKETQNTTKTLRHRARPFPVIFSEGKALSGRIGGALSKSTTSSVIKTLVLAFLSWSFTSRVVVCIASQNPKLRSLLCLQSAFRMKKSI